MSKRPDMDAIEKRCRAAAPWGPDGPGAILQVHRTPSHWRIGPQYNIDGGFDEADARFCLHARNDVPELLAYIRKLEASLCTVCNGHGCPDCGGG